MEISTPLAASQWLAVCLSYPRKANWRPRAPTARAIGSRLVDVLVVRFNDQSAHLCSTECASHWLAAGRGCVAHALALAETINPHGAQVQRRLAIKNALADQAAGDRAVGKAVLRVPAGNEDAL